MTKNIEAVFSVLAFASDGRSMLKQAVAALHAISHVQTLSSVYSVQRHPGAISTAHNILAADRYMGLVVAVKVITDLSPMDLVRKSRRKVLEKDGRFINQHMEVDLLLYGDLHLMLPQLTVPHPELHLLPELMIPAAEVWGDYYHSVLGKNLYSLAKNFSHENWGEFHSQGKALLDLKA